MLEGLKYTYWVADIAIVFSVNLQAVEEKWALCGLLGHVDILLAQNVESKAFCIAELLKKGYDKDQVLTTGDAPGDLDAARSNGVYCYLMLVRHEGGVLGRVPGDCCGQAHKRRVRRRVSTGKAGRVLG